MINLKIEKKQGSAANTNWQVRLDTNSRLLKVADSSSKPLWFHKYTRFFADAIKNLSKLHVWVRLLLQKNTLEVIEWLISRVAK